MQESVNTTSHTHNRRKRRSYTTEFCQFNVAEKDSIYAADITYIWTQEGWLYLAVVIDLYYQKRD